MVLHAEDFKSELIKLPVVITMPMMIRIFVGFVFCDVVVPQRGQPKGLASVSIKKISRRHWHVRCKGSGYSAT
jgi:hypothetical protein